MPEDYDGLSAADLELIDLCYRNADGYREIARNNSEKVAAYYDGQADAWLAIAMELKHAR